MRTGIATVPLDYGHCPRWLFERMKRLSRGIMLAIREEFGPEEILKRLSDPVWFQSLGCVIGFDYNSSGLTTTTLGALKVGIFDIQDELGIYVCGGKKESRKTPEEIEAYAISRGFSFAPNLIYASKMAAKVDSSLIQNIQSPFQIYQHNFIFSKSGQWAIIQQGMAPEIQKARRYHWLSSMVKDFVEEPHSGIVSDVKGNPLNLTARESNKNRKISTELVKEGPKTFVKDLDLIQTKRSKNLTLMELRDVEFYWHPVAQEKFDLKRLGKTIFFANEQNPKNFEQLLSLKGIGPKTIRALSLVSELIYGAKPSYEDPARYSFTHGGKDGTPYFPKAEEMDKTIEIMERGIKKAKVSNCEKLSAQERLNKSFLR
ncbi:MAG: DUF763 domain-containing protein [Candidatus Nealsonbacteria bacterium CG10_big_fil_rev_8_21_14_0_10_36_24]|uniref:DUF763 domain-containing protein n=2 Tax=Candidatus Nealsoniibacteriota TaxID=1817911 RepID=A0A2H0YQK9_9BACT|nr:MAG: DUF763 domain-containing protein [Candidatus Nealsonbacteria bacterium CG10_big_fil_rev_8_21_14_0_10_36_24]PIS40032.1 MAG: DUF763 domain-containing protein [Candidatus Nealsonbacteria bacterium CG08_land_8_20_14_0_20_36_22]